MKNNPNTKYVLIALVAAIWGLIIYKIVNGLKGDDIPLPKTTYKPIAKEDSITTYTLLHIAYADPFSNKVQTDRTYENYYPPVLERMSENRYVPPGGNPANNQGGNNSYNNYSPTPKIEDPLPIVKYNGYIYNPQTRKKTALISYNGRTMVVGIADKIEGKTKVVNIEEQRLTLHFNGKKMVVLAGS